MSQNIKPFRMKIDKQVEGIDVVAFMSRNNIGLDANFSFPFNLILYKGDNKFITMTDEYRWDKYNSIPKINYNDHKKQYNY